MGQLGRNAAGIVETELSLGNCIVVDGSAIKSVVKSKTKLNDNAIFTPHSNEFKSIGYTVTDDLNDRIEKAMQFAGRHNCTLVLKGHYTIVTNGSSIKVNKSSSSALATMGTGDVLAGMIAAYAAMHGNAFESAVAAVTAHSMVGDLLYKNRGNHIIAMDLIDALPSFLKGFDKVVD